MIISIVFLSKYQITANNGTYLLKLIFIIILRFIDVIINPYVRCISV